MNMAEDDEIDILGDFDLDSFLTKNTQLYERTPLVSQDTELLNCDYTIHPQWLLDKPSTDCWYNNSGDLSNDDPMVKAESGVACTNMEGHVSTEDFISDDSGWTEKEKNLLERGIDIFGKSHVRLAQFIGSKAPCEVKYYLKYFYAESSHANVFTEGVVEEIGVDNNFVSDILHDTQIPASIEEVIAAVSTAKATINTTKKKTRKKTYSNNSEDGMVLEENLKKMKKKSKQAIKFKIKTKLKFPLDCSTIMTKRKNSVAKTSGNLENNSNLESRKIEITTGEGLGVPLCDGEEIVKISKNDSDVEIDVEDLGEVSFSVKPTFEEDELPEISKLDGEKNSINSNKPKFYIDLSAIRPDLVEDLTSLEVPKMEMPFYETEISELEKVIHGEFFEGRATKTPQRYLKIRNHIINCWLAIKPLYVTKTSIRQGLKNCGDVNCISRIHLYLEQMGIINFGCAQTTYIRPLLDVFQTINPPPREKNQSNTKKTSTLKNDLIANRSRIKRKFHNDGEGGCTLTHNEKGDVINTTIVNENATSIAKAKSSIKRPAIHLTYCRSFSKDHPQKHLVKINLTTLLQMDAHAHTSLSEVMGLIGGQFSNGVLTISYYAPCDNIASSATHCDMCPISQSRAADLIHSRNIDILGWFHSHPTFAPEPSQQDIETQNNLQSWIGTSRPCVGVILSPFCAHGALIASPFRCMIVDKEHGENNFVPFKLNVEIIPDVENVEEFLLNIVKIFNESDINLKQPYFQNASLNYLEKYITSVRMHLAKCGSLNKMLCDYIVEKISNI